MGDKAMANLYFPRNINIYSSFIAQHFSSSFEQRILHNDYDLNWYFDVQQFKPKSLRKAHALREYMSIIFPLSCQNHDFPLKAMFFTFYKKGFYLVRTKT